jgi:hypothetical protein
MAVKQKKTGSANGKASKAKRIVRDGFVMERGEFKGKAQLQFSRNDDEEAYFRFNFRFGNRKAKCIKAFIKEISAFADEANGDA